MDNPLVLGAGVQVAIDRRDRQVFLQRDHAGRHRGVGREIVTVAVRRVSLPVGPVDPRRRDPKRYTLLPNTAGCYTADEAIRTATSRGRPALATS